jgi:hypothetical protein
MSAGMRLPAPAFTANVLVRLWLVTLATVIGALWKARVLTLRFHGAGLDGHLPKQ